MKNDLIKSDISL